MSLFHTYLRQLLKDGNPYQVLDLVQAYADRHGEKDLMTEAIVLSGELARLKRAIISGTDTRSEMAGLCLRIADLISTVPEGVQDIFGDSEDGEGMREINGGLYWGQWLGGFPNGYGMVYLASGQRITGLWVRGVLVRKEV